MVLLAEKENIFFSQKGNTLCKKTFKLLVDLMSFYISMHITLWLIKIWSVHYICRLSSKHLWFMTLNFKTQFQKILPTLFLAWWDHKSFSTKILDLFPDLTSWFLLPLGSGVILMGSQWTVRSASSVQFPSRETALSNFQPICINWIPATLKETCSRFSRKASWLEYRVWILNIYFCFRLCLLW